MIRVISFIVAVFFITFTYSHTSKAQDNFVIRGIIEQVYNDHLLIKPKNRSCNSALVKIFISDVAKNSFNVGDEVTIVVDENKCLDTMHQANDLSLR